MGSRQWEQRKQAGDQPETKQQAAKKAHRGILSCVSYDGAIVRAMHT
jgi:hypothetical protein